MATLAELNTPSGLSFDASGNLFIAAYNSSNIREVNTLGVISTTAGGSILGGCTQSGSASIVYLMGPTAVEFNSSGSYYIADYGNNRICKVTGGSLTTIAGSCSFSAGYSGDGGAATSAKLNAPIAIAIDASGNLFVAEEGNNCIRKITAGGIISTIAGNGTAGYSGDGGPAVSAKLSQPVGIAIDGAGNIYVSEYGNQRIRVINANGIISTYAGTGVAGYSGDGGNATSAKLHLDSPSGLAVDNVGNLYIADTYNHVIRKIDNQGIITTVAGNGFGAGTSSGGYSGDGGPATAAELNVPVDVALDATGNLFIADKYNQVIRKVALCSSPISVNIAGTNPVCGGSSNVLTATGASTYTWSANTGYAVSNTVSINLTDVTTYTVIGSTGGCYAKTSITVSVNPIISISGPTSICPGTATTLTGSGATNYTWSSNAGSVITNTASVAPFTNTTYTLTGSTGGCVATKTVSISMITPVVSVIGSTNICKGNSTVLTAQGASTYTWSSNAGGVTTNTVSLSPLADSVYTIIGTNAGCTTSNTVVVHVGSPTPTLTISGTTGICIGGSTTLTAGTAATYSWSSNAGGVTTNTVTVNPTSNTVYTVTGSNGACSVVKTVTVTVSTITPTVSLTSNKNNICSGVVVTFSANASSTHTLSPGGSTAATVTITPSSTTIYTLTSSQGSCKATDTLTIFVTPTPTLSIAASTTVCSGVSDTLRASGASTYTWSANLGSVHTSSVVVNTVYNGPGGATFNTYTVSSINGACAATKTISITTYYAPVVTPQISQEVCGGSSVAGYNLHNFSNRTGTAYYWTNDNTAIGLAASGTTTAIFSYTAPTVSSQQVGVINAWAVSTGLGNCVGNTETFTITIDPSPTVTVTGSTTLCGGSAPVVLTANGANTFTWSANAGGVNTNTVSVSPSSTTIYTVSGSYTNSCTNSSTFTITTSPQINISNSGNVCAGSTATLTASGANTYTWSTSDLVSTVSVNPTSNTTYSVSGTDINGCVGAAVTTVSVNPSPTVTINGGAAVCYGTSEVLTANGANTYTWSTSSISNTVSVSPVSNTVYSVTGTNSNGCSGTATATVIVNASPTIVISGVGTICLGTTEILTATGASTYTWNTSNISNTVSISPTTNTNYSVTGTDANGCLGTTSTSVVVNPTPTITISGVGTICAGDTETLVANGAMTYTWNTADYGSALVISPTTNTLYSITGTDINGCSGSSSFIVSVNPLPVVAVNSPDICIGSTATLVATGANTYTWNTGASGQSLTTTPTVSTNYTVIGTDVNNCTNVAIALVNVNSLPVVIAYASDTSICAGQSDTLKGSGALTYTWSSGITDNMAFTPSVSQIYTVTGTDASSCINTNTVNVTVNPLPQVSLSITDSVVCDNGSVVNLAGSPSGGVYSGIAVSGNNFDPLISGVGTFNVTYVYTDMNSCTDSSVKTITVNGCLNIPKTPHSNSFLSVYPNPFSSDINIENVTGTPEVVLIDILGEKISSFRFLNLPYHMDLSNLKDGIYFLEIKTESGCVIRKIIKH